MSRLSPSISREHNVRSNQIGDVHYVIEALHKKQRSRIWYQFSRVKMPNQAQNQWKVHEPSASGQRPTGFRPESRQLELIHDLSPSIIPISRQIREEFIRNRFYDLKEWCTSLGLKIPCFHARASGGNISRSSAVSWIVAKYHTYPHINPAGIWSEPILSMRRVVHKSKVHDDRNLLIQHSECVPRSTQSPSAPDPTCRCHRR